MLWQFNTQDAKAVQTPVSTAENLSKEMPQKTSEETGRMMKYPDQVRRSLDAYIFCDREGRKTVRLKHSAAGDSKLVGYSDAS